METILFLLINNNLASDYLSASGPLRTRNDTRKSFAESNARGANKIKGLQRCKLHPVGPDVLSGLIVFLFDQAKSVLAQFASFTETMPDELSVWMSPGRRPRCLFCPGTSTGRRLSRSRFAMRVTLLRARN
jgi:hypothetical protein